MGIFLTVLKIIGITLLCILLLLILFILLIMFWPFSYRLEGGKEEALSGRAKLSWLLHLLSAEVIYDRALNIRVRVFGIPFYDMQKRRAKKERAKKQDAESAAEEPEVIKEPDKDGTSESTQTAGNAGDAENAAKEPQKLTAAETEVPQTEPGQPEEAGEGRQKRSFSEILTDLEEALDEGADELEAAIYEAFDSLEESIDRISGKISGFAETLDYYRRILSSEGAAWVYDYVIRHVKACLRNIRPRRIDAKAVIKDDDPAAIAKVWQLYALGSVLMPDIKGSRELETLQDNRDIRCSILVKGRFTAGVLGIHGLCLLLNKKVRRFIKLIKREDKTDGRK